MANTAFLPKQDGSHADIIRTFLRQEDIRVTVRAVQPFGMLLVWIDHVRHRPLDLMHDIQVHNDGLGIGVRLVIAWFDLILFQ